MLSKDKVIGEVALGVADEQMNVYSGRLRVTDAYFEVRPIFKLYSAAEDVRGAGAERLLGQYYRERDALALELRLADGSRLDADWIHIVDVTDDLEDVHVDVALRERPASDADLRR